MASNIQLTTGRDREIAGLILLFLTPLSSKVRSRLFVDWLGFARVKYLGWLRKKERKKEEEGKEDDETRFSPLPGSSL